MAASPAWTAGDGIFRVMRMNALLVLVCLAVAFVLAQGEQRPVAMVAVVLVADRVVVGQGWTLPDAGSRWTLGGVALALLVWLGWIDGGAAVNAGLLLGAVWFAMSSRVNERALSILSTIVLAIHVAPGPWGPLALVIALGWVLVLPRALHLLHSQHSVVSSRPAGLGPSILVALITVSLSLIHI